MKKFTITILLLLLLLPLTAEASVKYITPDGVPAVAVDHCSKTARNIGAAYIEFCDYDFQTLDNKSPFYYIILLEDTYFVTTSEKAYATVIAAIHKKNYDNFFRAMLKCFIMNGTYGAWNVLGYVKYDALFGFTFVPNRNMLQSCWKNKKNRYFFEKERIK